MTDEQEHTTEWWGDASGMSQEPKTELVVRVHAQRWLADRSECQADLLAIVHGFVGLW